MKTTWALISVLLLPLVHCQNHLSPKPEGAGSENEMENEFRDMFEDADAFERFKDIYQKGLYSKDKVFNLRDPEVRAATSALVELLISAKEGKSMAEVPQRLHGKINVELLYYAMAVAVINRKGNILEELPYAEEYLNLPEWHDIMSNYFIPKDIINEFVEGLKEGKFNKSERLLVPEDSEWATYMTDDPVLNSMYYNWHIVFPTWADPKKLFMTDVKNRGQLYYDFHSQLLANYFMKLATKQSLSLCSWTDSSNKIMPGFKSQLNNHNGQPIASRSPMTPAPKSDLLDQLIEIDNKLEGTRVKANRSRIYVNDTCLFSLSERPESAAAILSNLIFNTTESLNPEYYGSFYDTAVKYLASIGSDPAKDGGGPAGYMLTALRDPAYYTIMECVMVPIKAIQYSISGPYSQEDLTVEDLTIDSLGVDRLQTFFEVFEVGLMNPARPVVYPVDQLRLNHKPFAFRFKLTNSGALKRHAVVTIVLLRARSEPIWHPVLNQYQIMDRFPVEVGPGEQLVERHFNESLIFTDEKNSVLRCGIPKSLALPKGEPGGLNLTLLAFLSPFDPSKQEPTDPKEEQSRRPQVPPLCGNTRLNYGLSFGFPLDKPLPPDVNYASAGVTVYHEVRTFPGGVRL